jgi:hypothetical protein
MTSNKFLFVLGISFFAGHLFAQTSQKTQMRFVTSFEAGQPEASIYKLYDASDDVICYILMPETAGRKQVSGKWVYDSNSLGSLSCLKANSTTSNVGKKVN